MPKPQSPPPNLRSQQDVSRLIRGVARSFALSLLWLPPTVRGPVGLAYLLARASDTVADSMDEGARDPRGQAARRQALGELQATIQAACHEPMMPLGSLAASVSAVGAIPKASEQELLEKLDELIRAVASLPAADRRLIAGVCDTIVSGQLLDLQRFDHGAGELRALADSTEVCDYTWRVAGCVGHFWSEVCEAHVDQWREQTFERMKADGAHYGMGLQRLNLLRDTAQDLALGRCYWSAQELAGVGMTPQSLAQAVKASDVSQLNAMRPLMTQWITQVRADLSHGVTYALAVRPWRLRWACALPALLGLHTLEIIEQAGPQALTRAVKVPRTWVYGLMVRLTLGGLRRSALITLALEMGALPNIAQGLADNGTMAA
jgi:farnesyl-diphosphate farnesyltransferase